MISKQLVWVLTVTADGTVPIAYRLTDGNTSDAPTHVPIWDGLVEMFGRADFRYTADSKLCSREAMRHIAHSSGSPRLGDPAGARSPRRPLAPYAAQRHARSSDSSNSW